MNYVPLKRHIPSIRPEPSYQIFYIPPNWSIPPILFMTHVNLQCILNDHVMSMWISKLLFPPIPSHIPPEAFKPPFPSEPLIMFLVYCINQNYHQYQSCTTQTTYTIHSTGTVLSHSLYTPKWSIPPIPFMNLVNNQCRRNHHVMSMWTTIITYSTNTSHIPPKPFRPPLPSELFIMFLDNHINLNYHQYQSWTTQTTYTVTTTGTVISHSLYTTEMINSNNSIRDPCIPSMPS